VIHIPEEIDNKITFLTSVSKTISNTPCAVFDESRINFLSDLSKSLLSKENIREYPDVATFAFWCRKSNLMQIAKNQTDGNLRLGVGLAFHISPSNVPVNFAFSLAFGVLSGNICVIRLPSEDHISASIIIDEINTLLKNNKYGPDRNFIHLIKFDREDKVNQFWMSIADARIVWGGDRTVELMRSYKCKPRSREVVFPDRFSLSTIRAKCVLDLKKNEIHALCENLFNDIYIMDQNACTSPQLLAWVGDRSIILEAKSILWDAFIRYVKSKHKLEPIHYMDKYVNACENAILNKNVTSVKHKNNLLFNVELSHFNDQQQRQRGYFGTVHEISIKNLNELSEIIDERCQTLTYFGFDVKELKSFVVSNKLRGIDRIVPIGRSLDMGVIWDGYNIIEHLSRIVHIN
jgi:hypothetical protein